ncbi:pLS20_p028 family conjugation system transmembrane protein [Natribacillus halophilus]|uniref:DUF8208 domain-containing protein n=1 Tax=Natribacillus halophilus TaxID=549003 RepID=A0A1G8KJD5_9BACI|nr:hypothetical protein [Natribacillus halophilus]SDI43551.1 hypothetical protein SAMN04488123_102143 [Natribacillus halophilus]
MEGEELLDILRQFDDVLNTGDIISYLFRFVGWWLLLGFRALVSGMEGVIDGVLVLLDFFQTDPVLDFLQTVQPVLYILLALALAFIGYQLIFQRNQQRSQIPVNIFISIMTVTLLTWGMDQASSFTDDAVEVASVGDDAFDMADQIVHDHITDVAIYDETGWQSPDVDTQHHVDPENIDQIDINEEITDDFERADGEPLSNSGQEILTNKIGIESNGEEGLVSIGDDGWFDFFPENYYRWDINWGTALITLGVMALTMILVSIKIAKLCFELAFNKVVALIMAYADISSGQRLKEILKNIGSIFVSIIMVFLSLRMYMYYTEFIADQLSGFGYLIAMIAGSLAVIDGPNIVQKLFGIDAGLRNAWTVAAGSYFAGKAAKPAIQGAGQLASKGAKGAATGGVSTAAATAGGIKGLANGQGGGQGASPTNNGVTGQQGSPAKASTGQGQQQGSQPKGQSAPGTQGAGSPTNAQAPPSEGEGSTSNANAQAYQQTQLSGGKETPGQAKPTSTQGGKTPSLHAEMRENERQQGGASQQRPATLNQQMQAAAGGEEPPSTSDISMPQRSAGESRTVGQYMRDGASRRWNNNRYVQTGQRSYQLGKNTTENWRNKRNHR